MRIAASPFPNPIAAGLKGAGSQPTPRALARRIGERRRTLAVQAVSYLLGSLVLMVYFSAGTIPISIPSAFLVCGLTTIGFFLVLSETGINDRFEDHYLTLFQVAAHVAIQLAFLLAVPKIGFAFLNVLFLIFGVGSLRMSSRQAMIAWTLTTMGLAPIFLFTGISVGLPVGTPVERLAAMLCFVLTIGQCAFVGLYGSTLRKMLYQRGVELKKANRRIEELAELDELTGSFNRRCIMRMLGDEVARALRSKTPCSIALIDLDWFKRVNDAYGHPTGDEVLRTFAITVFANIRNIDRLGRYGGEEFLLVLPDTPHDTAARVLERLRAIIAELDWSALSLGMPITISAGVATLVPGETAHGFFTRADRALYTAKARGRNKISSA